MSRSRKRSRRSRPRSASRLHRQLVRWCTVIALTSLVALFAHPSATVTGCAVAGLVASVWALFASDKLAGLGSSSRRRRRQVRR